MSHLRLHCLAALIGILLATSSFAAEPLQFSSVLVDANCEDLDSETRFPWGGTEEATGSPNGKCDSDNRIFKAAGAFALTADTAFLPIDVSTWSGIYVISDGDAVTGGATTWRICFDLEYPYEPGTWKEIVCGANVTGNAEQLLFHGENSWSQAGVVNTSGSGGGAPLLDRLRVRLDLIGATSWTGSIGVVMAPK